MTTVTSPPSRIPRTKLKPGAKAGCWAPKYGARRLRLREPQYLEVYLISVVKFPPFFLFASVGEWRRPYPFLTAGYLMYAPARPSRKTCNHRCKRFPQPWENEMTCCGAVEPCLFGICARSSPATSHQPPKITTLVRTCRSNEW